MIGANLLKQLGKALGFISAHRTFWKGDDFTLIAPEMATLISGPLIRMVEHRTYMDPITGYLHFQSQVNMLGKIWMVRTQLDFHAFAPMHPSDQWHLLCEIGKANQYRIIERVWFG